MRSIAIVVGDVVGQGAAAAAVMGQLRTALAAYLLDGHGPRPRWSGWTASPRAFPVRWPPPPR
jgi:hypothetical protein